MTVAPWYVSKTLHDYINVLYIKNCIKTIYTDDHYKFEDHPNSLFAPLLLTSKLRSQKNYGLLI